MNARSHKDFDADQVHRQTMASTEGDKYWKSASKLTSASFLSFRLKSDWEQAGPLYEKAANAYRQGKAWERAGEAHKMAASCWHHQGSPWHAAKHLEKAAECAKEGEDMTLSLDYIKQAAVAFREAGRPSTAAETLTKGARWAEVQSPESASEMLEEAIEEVESEGKAAVAGDLYRQAIGLYIRRQRHGEAVGVLLKFAAACDESHATSSQCKAYLGAIIVWLYACDGVQAWAVYQDALEVEVFARSEEAFAAEALLESYKLASVQEVQQSIAKHPIFRDLDNQVARLAKQLPQGDLASISKSMGGVISIDLGGKDARSTAEEIDEEDLT